MSQEPPKLTFANAATWSDWLEKNHESSDGLWLKIAKKGSGIDSVTYDEAVEAALCYGWIDGQKAKFDDQYWLQKFGPRRPRSVWSKINTEKAERLITEGKMTEAGLREVEAAKADGRWEEAYEGQRTATVPEDFLRALDANPKAKEFYAKINSANRYAILWRINSVKRPETRARNIEKFVAMLAEGKTLH